jgi:hypothetical protein
MLNLLKTLLDRMQGPAAMPVDAQQLLPLAPVEDNNSTEAELPAEQPAVPVQDNLEEIKTSRPAAYTGENSRSILAATWKCARSGVHEKTNGPRGKGSKKCSCPFKLVGKISKDDPTVMIFEEQHGHRGHVPGSRDDLKHLSLHPEVIEVVQKVCYSLLCALF